MEAISYTHFRASLAGILDKVNDDSVPVQVTRKGGKGAVVISMDDWSSIQETLYVLQNKTLMRQINQAESERKQNKQGYTPTQEEMNAITGV